MSPHRRRMNPALLCVADEGAKPVVAHLRGDGERGTVLGIDTLRGEVKQSCDEQRRVFCLVQLGGVHALVELGAEDLLDLFFGGAAVSGLRTEENRNERLRDQRVADQDGAAEGQWRANASA